jgi:hypothetical protein
MLPKIDELSKFVGSNTGVADVQKEFQANPALGEYEKLEFLKQAIYGGKPGSLIRLITVGDTFDNDVSKMLSFRKILARRRPEIS